MTTTPKKIRMWTFAPIAEIRRWRAAAKADNRKVGEWIRLILNDAVDDQRIENARKLSRAVKGKK